MSTPARLLIAALTAALLSSPALASKFYRWVDENGVTHYTQTPPPEGKQGREVRTQGGASSDQPQELERLEQQRQRAEQDRRLEAGRAAEQAREKSEPDAVAKERCEAHRKNLDELRNRPVVRTTDPASGEVITLDEEQRQRMIQQTLDALKLCK
ncbi:MAG: DUF4124 domain-containing protein [Alcanivoracaceae bacterium]